MALPGPLLDSPLARRLTQSQRLGQACQEQGCPTQIGAPPATKGAASAGLRDELEVAPNVEPSR